MYLYRSLPRTLTNPLLGPINGTFFKLLTVYSTHNHFDMSQFLSFLFKSSGIVAAIAIAHALATWLAQVFYYYYYY